MSSINDRITQKKQQVMNNSELDFEVEEGGDPIKRLGIGIMTHFTMQQTYIIFLLFLTLINFPLYQIYKSNAKESLIEYGSYSMSDLGAAQNHNLIRFIDQPINLECEYGLVSEFTHFGVYQLASQADKEGLCVSDTQYKTGLDQSCKYYSDLKNPILKHHFAECLGQKSCSINGIQSLLGTFRECKVNSETKVYMQYSCKLS